MANIGSRTAGVVLVLSAIAAVPVAAQSAENVAVIINDNSAVSRRVGEYYVRKRGIPPSNVVRLHAPSLETIDRNTYVRTIEEPIAGAIRREALQDRVLYLVLTKGVPLRVAGTPGKDGTRVSVDSELTLLYRRMTGQSVPLGGPLANPYYLGDKPIGEAAAFTHRTQDIFLVTRLDGFTAEDALALVDRAQNPNSDGRIVLDQRSGIPESTGDRWLAEAAQRLEHAGHRERVHLEGSLWPASSVERVLGYYSWGSNDPAIRRRQVGLQFVLGALAATFVSTDARTFQSPPDSWSPSGDWKRKDRLFAGSPQTLLGDLIREGITGAAGHVSEPYLQSTIRPQILFPSYVKGFNLAEAFYLSMPHLSWQTVVIGDPLCAPFPRNALRRADIEDPKDAQTELPGLFSRRRLARLRVELKEDAKVLALALQAESRLASDDAAGARRALEQATELAPSAVALQLQLALLHDQSAEPAAAIERYRAVLKVQRDNAIALNNLAYALAVHRKSFAEAVPLARRAVALAPNNPTVLDTLAWIEHLQGNSHTAAKLLSEAIRRGATHPEVRVHAAVVYAALGAWAASETQLAEALRLDASLAERDDVVQLQRRLAEHRTSK